MRNIASIHSLWTVSGPNLFRLVNGQAGPRDVRRLIRHGASELFRRAARRPEMRAGRPAPALDQPAIESPRPDFVSTRPENAPNSARNSGLAGRPRIRAYYRNPLRTKDQTACKPGSVEGLAARDGHSSGPPIAGRFSRPTRTPRAGEPCRLRGAASLFGLAPGGACHAAPVASGPVGSYPTLSPLPFEPQGLSGRFAFCGAIPRVTPGGRYPPPFRRGARTFLDRPKPAATARPSDPKPL